MTVLSTCASHGRLALLLLFFVGASATAQTPSGDPGAAAPANAQGPAKADSRSAIELVREALAKQSELQDLISKERNQWRVGKGLLEDQIEMVRAQIERAKKQTAEHIDGVAKAGDSKKKLLEKNAELKAQMAALDASIGGIEERTKALLPRLPAIAAERIERYSQRLPEDPAKSELDAARRFTSVIAILNDLNRFNREISTASEVRKLGEGLEKEVTTVYLGLGQGFYVTANGDAAGIGTATESSWVWSPSNAQAAEIAGVVKVLQGEQVASFINVPVRVQ